MSYNEEILGHVMDKAADYKEDTGADLVGINMEGPFINLKKPGRRIRNILCRQIKKCFCVCRREAAG